MTKQTPHTVDANGTERKQCSKCKEWKALGEYHRDKTKEDGLRTNCKECRLVKDIKYRQKNKKKIIKRMKNYYANNKTEIAEKQKKYYQKKKHGINENQRKRYREDEQYRQDRKKYQKHYTSYLKESEPEKYRAVQNRKKKWAKEKAKTNNSFRISLRIRSGVSASLRRAKLRKKTSTFKFTACSAEFLIQRLEKMQIERGLNEYCHIDHMMPVNSFDLNDAEQLRRCWHWSNLQVLSKEENLSKSDKIIYDMKWSEKRDQWLIRNEQGKGPYRPTALFRSLLLV